MVFLTQYIRSLLSRERGEDVTEYALVLGLVAIAAVVAIGLVGGSLNTWWTNLHTQICALNALFPA